MLGRGFHTPIKNVSFSSPTEVGSHNPLPSGPSVLVGTHYLLQSMWDLPIHLPSRPSVLAGTPPHVHPPSGFSLLAGTLLHVDIICNSPSPPLAYIVLFGFSLLVFSQIFRTRLLVGGFYIVVIYGDSLIYFIYLKKFQA